MMATKSASSTARKQLIEIMQRLAFGRIENLEVRGGEPSFAPPPRIIQDIKLGNEHAPRLELEGDDFLLKAAVIDLFEHLKRVGDGTVAVIEVRHGLPHKLEIQHPAIGYVP
jgi:hypothetical protein